MHADKNVLPRHHRAQGRASRSDELLLAQLRQQVLDKHALLLRLLTGAPPPLLHAF